MIDHKPDNNYQYDPSLMDTQRLLLGVQLPEDGAYDLDEILAEFSGKGMEAPPMPEEPAPRRRSRPLLRRSPRRRRFPSSRPLQLPRRHRRQSLNRSRPGSAFHGPPASRSPFRRTSLLRKFRRRNRRPGSRSRPPETMGSLQRRICWTWPSGATGSCRTRRPPPSCPARRKNRPLLPPRRFRPLPDMPRRPQKRRLKRRRPGGPRRRSLPWRRWLPARWTR